LAAFAPGDRTGPQASRRTSFRLDHNDRNVQIPADDVELRLAEGWRKVQTQPRSSRARAHGIRARQQTLSDATRKDSIDAGAEFNSSPNCQNVSELDSRDQYSGYRWFCGVIFCRLGMEERKKGRERCE